jgi:2-dehydropantoate 2-reductase
VTVTGSRNGRAPQRVAVVGAGSIGTVMAAGLLDAGHDVVVGTRPPAEQLVLEDDAGTRTLDVVTLVHPDDASPVDWVILATKTVDTEASKPWLDALVGPDTVVVATQNGIDLVDRIQPLVPGTTVLPTVLYTNVERIRRGHYRHHAGRRIVVPVGETADAFAALVDGRFDVVADPDFELDAWRKLAGNLAANALTALSLSRLGALTGPNLAPLTRALMVEAVPVANAEGVPLSEADIDHLMALFAAYPPEGGTSMLFDRLHGRRLEYEAITGAVVAKAHRHGVPVPLNEAMLALLRQLDASLATEAPTRLEATP